MAAVFTLRPGFDDFARLKCKAVRTRGNPTDFFLSILKHDPLRAIDYRLFLYRRDGVICDWLKGDHVTGHYTVKFFLDQVLVSFSDRDSAFAFKMRFC